MIERLVTHFLAHPAGVIGLILNTAGAFGLLRFMADPDAGSPLTHEQLTALRSVSPELRRPYNRLMLGYRLSLVALAIGFTLQLADLLLA